jgi:hypothetical protein
MKRRRILIITGVMLAVVICVTAAGLAMAKTGEKANQHAAAAQNDTSTSAVSTTVTTSTAGATGDAGGDATDETTETGASPGGSPTKPHPFGQYVSGLRHAGNHTPAAQLQGKEPSGDDDSDDTTVEDGDEGTNEQHVPAAVQMGKKVPGWSAHGGGASGSGAASGSD